MDASIELKKWVDSLSMGEKRFIKQLGEARSRSKGSQQLELLNWLETAKEVGSVPASQGFSRNFASVSDRLKNLILDGLHLLHKETNTDARIHSGIDEVAILYDKKLFAAATRKLKRAKKLAYHTSRYNYVLICLEWERKLLHAVPPPDMFGRLSELFQDEKTTSIRQQELARLRNCHDCLRVRARQILAPRDQALLGEIAHLASDPVVEKYAEKGPYLEHALAVNILGIRNLLERDAVTAFERYKVLLKAWEAQPKWQLDQEHLVLLLCTYFQIACFTSPMEWSEAKKQLDLLQAFRAFSPAGVRNFQRMLNLNQFTLALNTGNFESVKTLISEIDRWLGDQGKHLSEVHTLPFLHNFAVAEFLAGNHSSANKFVLRILNMPGKATRKDIREFALVLQAVLQYELGNSQLNEYLTRSGKRFFAKKTNEMVFELAVFKFIQNESVGHPENESKRHIAELIQALEDLTEALSGTVPLLGLMEMKLWAKSKMEGVALKDLFLRAVKENMEENS